MRVLIYSDDKSVSKELKTAIKYYFSNYRTPVDLSINAGRDDILESTKSYNMAFIDLETAGPHGLRVAARLKEINSRILIFTLSVDDRYMDDAFDLKVFRYLPKPIDRRRTVNGIFAAMKLFCDNDSFLLENGDNISRIFKRDILFVTKAKRKTIIVTKNASYESDKSIFKWRSILYGKSFAYPRYNYIINLHNIVDLGREKIVLEKNEKETVTIKFSPKKVDEIYGDFFSYLTYTHVPHL